MSTTTLTMLLAVQRNARQDRADHFRALIAAGETPARAHYYTHPSSWYSPLQLATGRSFNASRRIARRAVGIA